MSKNDEHSKEKERVNNLQAEKDSYTSAAKKLKIWSYVIIAMTCTVIISTIVIEIIIRVRHSPKKLASYIDRNIQSIRDFREKLHEFDNLSQLTQIQYKHYVDPLEPWQSGRQVWLRDMLVYVNPDGEVKFLSVPDSTIDIFEQSDNRDNESS